MERTFLITESIFMLLWPTFWRELCQFLEWKREGFKKGREREEEEEEWEILVSSAIELAADSHGLRNNWAYISPQSQTKPPCD